MGDGGGGSSYKESPETRALTAQQTGILKDIQSTVQQLDPTTFSLMGLKQMQTQADNPAWVSWNNKNQAYQKALETHGTSIHTLHSLEPGAEPTRYVSKSTYAPMTEAERVSGLQGTDKQMYDLQQLQYQRLFDSYNGNIGVSPALEANLSKQQSTLQEQMAQKLGANWAQSTPGIQAMGEFNKQAELLREEARRAQLSEGQGLLMNNLNYQEGTNQNRLSNLVNVPSARYQGNLGSGATLLNTLSQQDSARNSYNASQNSGISSGSAALGGAASGAATGAMLFPANPLIGGAVGGVIGGIGGLLFR